MKSPPPFQSLDNLTQKNTEDYYLANQQTKFFPQKLSEEVFITGSLQMF